MKKFLKFGIVGWVVTCFLVGALTWLAIGYVVVHFISKYW
jgi:hypothetical protein